MKTVRDNAEKHMKVQGSCRDRDQWFAELYAEADEAGRKAAAAVDPKHFGCGFAWVIVNGNSAFGRWAKHHQGWERRYFSSMCLSIRDLSERKPQDCICASLCSRSQRGRHQLEPKAGLTKT
jgi:hypothetical protein